MPIMLQTLQPITRPYPQPPPLPNSHTPGQYCSALLPQGWLGHRRRPPPQSNLPTLLRLAKPKPFPLPCLSCGKQWRFWALLSPHCFCLRTTGVSPGSPAWCGTPLLFANVIPIFSLWQQLLHITTQSPPKIKILWGTIDTTSKPLLTS